jgi:Tfp pilus assembly protein PilZ
MKKKVTHLFLYLVILILLLLMFIYGVLVRQGLEGTTKFGKFSEFAVKISRVPANLKYILELKISGKKVMDHEYLVDTVVDQSFIKINKSEYSNDNLYLHSRFDLEKGNFIFELRKLDDFSLLHTYYHNKRLSSSQVILPDGNVIAYSDDKMIKIDLCNNVEILNDERFNFHHSLELTSNNLILSTNRIKVANNKYFEYFPEAFNDDAIFIFKTDGTVIYRKSISEILIENNYIGLLFGINTSLFLDPIHLNDIEMAEKNTEYYRKNDLFLSLRHRSVIIHYRPETNEIVNIISGPFSKQHDIEFIDDDKISIFNNNLISQYSETHKYGDHSEKLLGNNQILIYSFKDKSFSKAYEKLLNQQNINTPTQGLYEIGDDFLLVEEHDEGSAYLFSNNELVWKSKNIYNKDVAVIGWGSVIRDQNKVESIMNKINEKNCND